MRRFALILLFLALLGDSGCQPQQEIHFSGARAFDYVKAQLSFGPRPTGSDANHRTSDYIAKVLRANGWAVEFQDFAYKGVKVRNVIGKKGKGPVIILGAHFDTRPVADRDPSDRSLPVPGADDGASGAAVLLELSRVLSSKATDQAQVWLAFFDAEDRGELNNWEWGVGAAHMAQTLTVRPEYVLVVDMIGDMDQRIYYEWTSTLWLQERLFTIADQLGYRDHFIPQMRYAMEDDHTPFLAVGVQAAVLIDFDYPYWHTRYDTLDKISADSLQRVGDVLVTLLEGEPFASPANIAGTTPYP